MAYYIAIALLIAAGVIATAWVFASRRHLDRDGRRKATARNPREVRRQNAARQRS